MSIEIYAPWQADRAIKLSYVDNKLKQIRMIFGGGEKPVTFQRDMVDLTIDRNFIRGVERIVFSLWEDLAVDPIGKALADSILKR